jgi:hypothetical protein
VLLCRTNVSFTGEDELTEAPCKKPVEKMFRGFAVSMELLGSACIVPRKVRARRRLMIVSVLGVWERWCRTFNSNRKSYVSGPQRR